MNTINIKDTVLSNTLIGELNQKKLSVETRNVDGYTTYFYASHQRPKVFFKKVVIGRVDSVSCSGAVSLALDHPKGINFLFGPEKQFVHIGKKRKVEDVEKQRFFQQITGKRR
jgi:hypothetical protein